jgi:hypothetical protein
MQSRERTVCVWIGESRVICGALKHEEPDGQNSGLKWGKARPDILTRNL